MEDRDLPWERLVYDQKIEYQPKGAEKAAFYRVRHILRTAEGPVYAVAEDKGPRQGADPKKILAAPTDSPTES